MLIQDEAIGEAVGRPDGATVVDLSNREISLGFIDTHVRSSMD